MSTPSLFGSTGQVAAPGLFVVLFAAATPETDPAVQATQVVHQVWDGRNVVTATRLAKAGEATPGIPPAEDGNSVQFAALSPLRTSRFNPHDPKGDDHAE